MVAVNRWLCLKGASMSIIEELVSTAKEQWTRWGGPFERVDGSLGGFTDRRMEAKHPFWTFVGEYWQSIGSDLDGRDSPAWSAAFICYCFNTAGAGNRFPYSDNHSIYVSKIDSGNFAGLSLVDPTTTPVAVGDLLWASRSGDGCRAPPLTFADAKREVKRIRDGRADSFCSHSDIVVAIRDGQVDVIGGNVKQAVTRTTYRLDTSGRIRDGRRSFVGVIRNAL
ncbi:DUF2272 domain-containing protein (plasmid) [Rhizobium ruizarguesonis]|nr:DUF2272 domain-containing protein [Rhizobium ruizarguesonis]TAZ92255.1 DUF2272 domain-containing protein [Rhizobium ruizarguesonis]